MLKFLLDRDSKRKFKLRILALKNLKLKKKYCSLFPYVAAKACTRLSLQSQFHESDTTNSILSAQWLKGLGES